MTLIDGDRIVTVQIYDDEHEEFTEKKMSIIDFINGYTDEGVTTADDVLDKIRAEINTMPCAITSMKEIYVNRDKVINIIDKYKGESEE